MAWNHRVVRRVYPAQQEGVSAEETYAIHEVHFLGRGDDAHIHFFTNEPVAPVAGDMAGLKWTLEKMLAALDKPVLDYDNIVGQPMVKDAVAESKEA